MHRVTVKTSTIFIAKSGRTRVYRSVSDVPKRLRAELEQSTNGFNSATILIADRRGRQEILRALNGLPTGLRSRLATSLAPAARIASTRWNWRPLVRFLRRAWLPALLPALAGAGVWVAFNFR